LIVIGTLKSRPK